MKNNNLLMIILAFIVGYYLNSMMKNMCEDRLFEGNGGGTTTDQDEYSDQWDRCTTAKKTKNAENIARYCGYPCTLHDPDRPIGCGDIYIYSTSGTTNYACDTADSDCKAQMPTPTPISTSNERGYGAEHTVGNDSSWEGDPDSFGGEINEVIGSVTGWG